MPAGQPAGIVASDVNRGAAMQLSPMRDERRASGERVTPDERLSWSGM